MADDNIQRTPETLSPAPLVRVDQATTATPPPPPPPPLGEVPAPRQRSEVEQFLRWGAGLVLVMMMGWGFIAFIAYLAYHLNLHLDLSIVIGLAAILSLAGFVALQRNLWLSRFMGLRTEANPSPFKEAFFLWFLGVPGLLWRSTEGRDAAPATDQKTQSDVSNTREVIETVVFVVVLVLLLKSFVAEAFVIPTGSMATTLYGYQKIVDCPKCHFVFPVNCSQEVDPQEGSRPTPTTACVCPNCREEISLMKTAEERNPHTGQREKVEVPDLEKYNYHTGDRVLVGKFLYDLPWGSAEKHRLNVVVFKYPKEPQKGYTPMNYIKRLIGLPGETIGIYYGKIYILPPESGLSFDDSNVPELDRWQYEYMHVDAPQAIERWKEFHILRKPPDVVLAQRRIVYDFDHPAEDLKNWPRWKDWSENKAWAEDGSAHAFKHAAGADPGLAWLRYQNIIARGGRTAPELITDFMGYNSFEPQTPHWVGDLMLECDVTIDKPEGQVVLELSRGSDRFRAIFDLTTGECTLKQIKNKGDNALAPADDAEGVVLDKKPTALKKSGTYHVRFANVDDRLLLWVDHDLPFGEEGASYTPPSDRGPDGNDLWPASIGVKGAGVTVSKLQLWRDTYYTQMVPEGRGGAADEYPRNIDFAKKDTWHPLNDLKPMTLYVQPGHYLCLGDNSPHSSDGRAWGLVPDRLMLGRALVVYYPFPPMGNRAGPIH
jgi:signal peptidase I